MKHLKQIGFSLIEVLVSLLILSLILLGFDCMQIYALRENRNAYYFSVAANQLISLANLLRKIDMRQDFTKQIMHWNNQNNIILPFGKGYVSGTYPFYTATLFWGDKTTKQTCKDIPIGKLKCLSITIQSGITLIELMLALTISLLALSIVTTIYISAEKNFRVQSALSNIQENARTAFELLSNDISMAGYIGCAKLTADFPIKSYHHYNITPESKALLTEKNSLSIRHASVMHADLNENMQNNSVLYTTSDINFSENDILLISDCKSAEIFQAMHVSLSQKQQKIITTAPLANKYEKNAEVSKFQVNKYFIADTHRGLEKPIYALYMTDIKNHTIELVESVDAMIMNMANQNGVEITLTFSSPDHFMDMKKTWSSYIAFENEL